VQRGEGGGDEHLRGSAPGAVANLGGEGNGLGCGLVHLPVPGDQGLSSGHGRGRIPDAPSRGEAGSAKAEAMTGPAVPTCDRFYPF